VLVAAAQAAGFVALWTLALGLAGRTYYLIRLFPGFAMLRHAARAIAPSVPAAAAVLGMRVLEQGPRTRAMAFVELGVYIVAPLLATYAFERPLLLEIAGYLRPRASTT
jgi:hypothetical protein